MRIAPFGNLRINLCLLIPAAYRSLPRPSSAPSAKAFPLRSFLLDLLCESCLLLLFPQLEVRLNLISELFSPGIRLLLKRTPASPFALFIQFSRYSFLLALSLTSQ